MKVLLNLYINLACLSVCLSVWVSVCLYSINVKTAEPIGPKFFVGHHVSTGRKVSFCIPSLISLFHSSFIHPSFILHSSFINPSFIRYRFVHVSEKGKCFSILVRFLLSFNPSRFNPRWMKEGRINEGWMKD